MLRLLSNNVWNCDLNQPAWAEKGADCSAPHRAEAMAAFFAGLRPDVIGTQEMTNCMDTELLRNLRAAGLRYTSIFGNYTAILYRPERLEVLDGDYLVFPEKYAGFEGEFNDVRSKSCNMAVFRDKENGKVFLFATAHLWWMVGNDEKHPWYQAGSSEVRAIQMEMAASRIEELRQAYRCPAVLVGDMNEGYRSAALQKAFACGFRHAHDVATDFAAEENGYHWCGGDGYVPYEPKPFEEAIDHILVKDMPKGAVRRFERPTPALWLPLSDHFPVYIDLEL